MTDFIAAFEPGDSSRSAYAERALQARPGMGDVAVRTWRFAWGWVTVQQPRCFGYEPYEQDGQLYFAVGRPRKQGWRHEDDGPAGFAKLIEELVHRDDAGGLYEQLTGMFVLVGGNEAGLTLFTDPMGVYAVYQAQAKAGPGQVIGTAPELVADLAGRSDDYDPVSLAEILLQDTVTFPYTTRHGMRELDAGSRHTFRTRAGEGVTHTAAALWLPREPDRWPSLSESQEALRSALRVAGEDVTRGADKVAVTLSGGVDSRTVLSCVPAEKRALAVTFTDHANNETQTAAAIAQATGVPHHLALRSPHFYAEVAERESRLTGAERGFVHAHGFALIDTPAPESFDLLLCGHMSDTLLKGCYSWIGYRGYGSIVRDPRTYLQYRDKPYHVAMRQYHDNQKVLKPAIRAAVQARLEERLKALKAIRPSSAAEWSYIYPLSRRATIGYTLSNARLFPSDQLFLHASVIAVACSARPWHKAVRALADPVFVQTNREFCGVPDANTGRPPDGSLSQIVLSRAKRRLARTFGRQTPPPQPKEGYPWYSVGSWVNFEVLLQESEVWRDMGQTAAAYCKVFDAVFEDDARATPTTYDARRGMNFNYNMVRLALARAAAVGRQRTLDRAAEQPVAWAGASKN